MRAIVIEGFARVRIHQTQHTRKTQDSNKNTNKYTALCAKHKDMPQSAYLCIQQNTVARNQQLLTHRGNITMSIDNKQHNTFKF